MKVGQPHFICHAQNESSDRHPGDLRQQRPEPIDRLREGEAQADIARTYGLDATTITVWGAHLLKKNGV